MLGLSPALWHARLLTRVLLGWCWAGGLFPSRWSCVKQMLPQHSLLRELRVALLVQNPRYLSACFFARHWQPDACVEVPSVESACSCAVRIWRQYRASSFVESLLWHFNLGMVMIIIDAPPVQYKQPGSRLQGKVPWVQTGCVVFYSLAEL